jgi:rhodanese-related sulfurtransferase
MPEPKRVAAEEIYQRVNSGAVLLVCAYEDEAKFKKLQLQGAISLNEFKSKLPSLAKDREIVFYCAWTQEASAAREAARYIEMGYKNAKALLGGVEAWKKAGYSMVGEK